MKLYVGNLPHSFSEQELTDLFSPYGEIVSCKLILDRETKKSRGFGFVEFKSKEDATKAINELNGKDVGGRTIIVNEARQREKREFSTFRRRF